MSVSSMVLKVFCVLMLTASSYAVPVLNLTGGTAFGFRSYTIGYEFTTSQDIYVTDIGVYNGGGMSGAKDFGIWTTAGTNLFTGTVFTTGTQINDFIYTAIAPVFLAAGTYRVGATNAGDKYLIMATPNVAPGFTITSDVYVLGTPLAYPSEVSQGPVQGGYVDFQFSLAVGGAPELDGASCTLPLALLSLGLLSLGKRRRN